MRQPLRVAVVGSGIAGLACAWRLAAQHRVTLFEADSRAGGHANTVDVTLEGRTHPVDTGFLVLNDRTYPNLIGTFAQLGVTTVPSEMSFSVSVGPHRFEWCGSNLATLFAQPSNAVSPAFWRMLADIVRFNRDATRFALAGSGEAGLTVGDYLDGGKFSASFRNGYLVPMAAAIWSSPLSSMLRFPMLSFARFCHNHGLLQVADRPQWRTVLGGSRVYVQRMLAQIGQQGGEILLGSPVRRVARKSAPGRGAVIELNTDRAEFSFDRVVLACHSDQSLALLADADRDEREALSAIAYQPNRAVLHTDAGLLPKRRAAWAAWNYLSDGAPDAARVSVSYLINRLQPLPFRTPVIVTLNPISEPASASVLAEFDYAHPVFDRDSFSAQQRLGALQGRRSTWFAGAWTGYGFHEDGLNSALAVVAGMDRLARGSGGPIAPPDELEPMQRAA